jgi:type I restriction enzyme S subunit
MVAIALKASLATQQQAIDIPEVEFKWSTVAISEVRKKDARLEASVFDIEGRNAHETVNASQWRLKTICGQQGIADAYHRPRFKRIFLKHSELPIYQPAQINAIYPKPHIWISDLTPTDIDALRVHKGQILLTCSGTIGNCAIVGNTLNKAIFSHDLIRITPKDKTYTGYIYAYLKTKIGALILTTNNYGAVISHIEPEHLNNVPIPDPDSLLRNNINALIIESVKAIDKSNELIDQAEAILIAELKLPPLEELQPKFFQQDAEMQNYQVKLSELYNRFDSSYHVPIVEAIENHIAKTAKEVTTIGDDRISADIILPGRFKRVYVEEGQGMTFIGGKQIYELDPSNKKYLSLVHHNDRIKEQLYLHENMVAITCSGTIGRVNIIPKHWENWTMNQHVMRIVPASDEIAGYIYSWLNSAYGLELIRRFTYGAVVDEIHDAHMAKVAIPMLKNKEAQAEINAHVLKANKLRFTAYEKEQQAIKMVNEIVIHATGQKLSIAAEPAVKYRNKKV